MTSVIVSSNGTIAPHLAFMGAYKGDWKYLDCHGMNWLLDVHQLSVAPAQNAGKVAHHRFVIEMVTQDLTPEQVNDFAAARKVEYRICNGEHEMSSSDLADLKVIKTRIDRDFPQN